LDHFLPRSTLPEAQPMADVAARDGGQAESDPEKIILKIL